MNERDFHHLVNVIATFTLLIPIFAGITKYKIAGKYFRLFFFLLIYGFLTDVLIWQLKDISRSTSFFLFNVYDLVEATVLFWFIRMTSENPAIKKICIILITIAIPSWFIIYFSYQDEQPHMAGYSTSYNIAVAFLTGFALLKLGETGASIKQMPMFWILMGLFVYSFCTFFITSLFDTELRDNIWFFKNTIAFVSYLIFTKGFLSIKSSGT